MAPKLHSILIGEKLPFTPEIGVVIQFILLSRYLIDADQQPGLKSQGKVDEVGSQVRNHGAHQNHLYSIRFRRIKRDTWQPRYSEGI